MTVGGYAGFGRELTFGRDQGHWFVTGRMGVGFGAGVSYDQNGSIPGEFPEGGNCPGGSVESLSLQTGINYGPIGVSYEKVMTFNAANNQLKVYDSSSGFNFIGTKKLK